MPRQLFVDTHVHFFNFVDIPLYETLEGNVCMNTISKMLVALSASGALLSGLMKSKIHDYKDFIQFFERSQEANILGFTHELANFLDTPLLVLNPLVMDFDCVRQSCDKSLPTCIGKNCTLSKLQPLSVAHDPYVENQLLRLQKAISNLEKSGKMPEETIVKIFPFLGFDLRKLTTKNSKAMQNLKDLWGNVGVNKVERKEGFERIQNGKVLGIKLYPPLGFNPCPDNQEALKAYKEFYEWCIVEEIPLTVHCQTGSFSLGRRRRQIKKDTHPRNWLRLFKNWGLGPLESDENIENLRINFAHFGGENGLEDMIDSFRYDGVDEESWTYSIVELVSNYKCAYTDLSAFDWSSDGDSKNFAKFLDFAKEGRLGASKYPVISKLLWGSDVPMVLDSDAYKEDGKEKGIHGYEHLFANFKEAVFKAKGLNEVEKMEVISNMTSNTPTQFLIG